MNFYQKKVVKRRLMKGVFTVFGVSLLLQQAFQAMPQQLALATNDEPTTTPVANPALGQSCGLDIALVVDTSGSVSATEMIAMKSALTNFASAFSGTPTVFSLSTFNTNSTQHQAFSRTPEQIAADISTNIPSAGNENTNWDSGLRRGFATFDPRPTKSNLLVFATDGSPNRAGYPTATSWFDWNNGLAAAIPTANMIKNAGTRIVVVGIGEDESDSATPAQKLEKMKSISGPSVATTPEQISAQTDVIKVTDFSGIGTALSAYASELCGGKILIQKQFDTNNDGVVDLDGSVADTALASWTFNTSGTSSPADQTTDASGALEFSVVNGTYAVQETSIIAGIRLTQATCTNGQDHVGTFSQDTRSVTGLTLASDQTIVCRFVNAQTNGTLKVVKRVVGSQRPSSDWSIHVQQQDVDVPQSPQLGSSTGTTYTLPAGDYRVSETGPAGFTASYAKECLQGNVTVVANQETVCVLTNTKNPDPVYSIALEKTGPLTAKPGDLLTYTLSWLIAGDHAVTQAIISDTLPANTIFESAGCGTTGNAFCTPSVSQGVVHWDIGDRQPGEHGTVEVTVRVKQPLANGTIVPNIACFDTNETLPKCDQVNTTITSSSILSLEKQGPATAAAGSTFTYALTWAVTGNAPVTQAIILDAIPDHTTFVSADSNAIFENNTIRWELGNKVPGDSGVVHVTVQAVAPIANGSIVTNRACFDTLETDEVCDTTTTTLQSAPQLSITKTNSIATFTTPGQSVLYTVTVTNAATATDAAREVYVTDILPAGFVFAVGGGTTKTFSLGTLVPGQSITTTYTATISAAQTAGRFTNTASAQGANVAKVSATSTVEVRVPEVLGISTPELTLKKSVSKGVINPDHSITYTLTIVNISDVAATNLVITDTLPKGFTFVDNDTRTMTWNVKRLAAGQSLTIPYVVSVGKTVKAGRYTNTASVRADEVDTLTAKRSVDVVVPQVLGLATTGVGSREYAVMALGLSLIGLGAIWYNHLRRRYGPANA